MELRGTYHIIYTVKKIACNYLNKNTLLFMHNSKHIKKLLDDDKPRCTQTDLILLTYARGVPVCTNLNVDQMKVSRSVMGQNSSYKTII
jgi:hypothetical protein